MRDGKYNEAVYMPKLNWRDAGFELHYTPHAQSRLEQKHISKAPKHINFKHVEIVEMEVENGKPFKVLARQAYDEEFDIILVILLKGLVVKTAWLNRRTDTHKTLKNLTQFIQA